MQRMSLGPHRILLSVGVLLLVLVGALSTWSWVSRLPAPAAVPSPTPVVAAGLPDARPTPTAAPGLSPAPAAQAPRPTALPAAPNPAPLAGVPNVRVSAGRFTAHSEVTLAQNPRDLRNFVGASKMFTDNQNYIFRVGTYASFDGGATWIDNGQLPGLEQWGVTSDPVVAFGPDGTVYVEVLGARGDDEDRSALYLYTSRDGGRTWSDPALISDDADGFNDKQWLASDLGSTPFAGSLYTTWTQIVDDTYRILFSWSRDGGRTWSVPETLAAGAGVTRQAAVVNVGANGVVYVLWSNLSTNHFELRSSDDGGANWSELHTGLPFRNVDRLNGNLRRGFVLASFVADPRVSGRLYMVWDDGRLGDADVLFSRSDEGGRTWGDPIVVNGTTRNDQFQPAIAVDPAGTVFVQWFDRRADPDDLLVHTFAARSTDGGASWSELRVTNVASDPTVGLPLAGKSGFYGDYQAVVADREAAQFFWNETRDGSQEVYTARVSLDRWGVRYRPRPAGEPGAPASPRQEAAE